jgi:GT2 family glycosyltransferase
VIEEVGGYDEIAWPAGCGEDLDMSKRIRSKGYNLVYDPTALVKHIKQDTVRSVLDTKWRWWRYGVDAYSGGIHLRSVLGELYYVHFRTTFFELVGQDLRSRSYELLWLDFLALLYMPYRDLQLYRQAWDKANGTKISSAAKPKCMPENTGSAGTFVTAADEKRRA